MNKEEILQKAQSGYSEEYEDKTRSDSGFLGGIFCLIMCCVLFLVELLVTDQKNYGYVAIFCGYELIQKTFKTIRLNKIYRSKMLFIVSIVPAIIWLALTAACITAWITQITASR